MNLHQLHGYDSSLRDGRQGLGVRFGVREGLQIIERLDAIGIPYIEAGWPGANPLYTDLFREVKGLRLKQAKVFAFGSTMKKDGRPEHDAQLAGLVQAEADGITLFGKTDLDHVTHALRTTPDENLRMIHESIAYLKRTTERPVFYDAEHFFDGFRKNPEYALKTLESAIDGGADIIILCDTNGGMEPTNDDPDSLGIKEVVKIVRTAFPSTPIGIHTHNDGGMADANAMSAIRSGATQIQGTMGGFGERTGNCDLITMIGNVATRKLGHLIPPNNESHLRELALFVGNTVGKPLQAGKPFVSRQSGTHKGGVHADAVMREPGLYEFYDLERFGNRRRIAVSDVAGTASLVLFADQLSIKHEGKGDPRFKKILTRIKEDEGSGVQYELADASLELLFREMMEDRGREMTIDHQRITDNGQSEVMLEGVCMGAPFSQKAQTTHGPVDAIFDALKILLDREFPENNLRLVNFELTTLDVLERESEAIVSVQIQLTDGENTWTTTAASEDILRASGEALAQGFDYFILKNSGSDRT